MHSDLETLIQRYPQLVGLKQNIQGAFDLLYESLGNNGKILLCGNGGSASDADHIAGELLKGFRSKRPLGSEEHQRLGEILASNLQGSLPAIPLPQLAATNTAWANDCKPEFAFAQLTFGLGNKGDILWAMSTSGNSANVVLAAEVAKAKGLKVISLTGHGGGKLKPLSDVCIHVPEEETFKIQELHLPVYHCLCLMLETAFFS